ncbi:Protein TIC 22, chloroplastic [Orobanche minor]
MESSSAKPSVGPSPKPLPSLPNLIHRLGTHFATGLDETKRIAAAALPSFLPLPSSLPFASVSQRQEKQTSSASETSLNSEYVAGRLVGTSVYTVSNTNNEFVLLSDPHGVKSIGLLCFRKEDAETFLAQVRSRRGELKGGAKVVPISLDQVYMLKVEGIAFRFLPDPAQIKHALELRASETKSGFDGVPVFQSDLLVVKKKNKRYCPIYFQKEDIEKALSTVSRVSRGPGVNRHIMVGSLEDVLKKMEISGNNSGWEDLIFIPPGKLHSQHIQEVPNV